MFWGPEQMLYELKWSKIFFDNYAWLTFKLLLKGTTTKNSPEHSMNESMPKV